MYFFFDNGDKIMVIMICRFFVNSGDNKSHVSVQQ